MGEHVAEVHESEPEDFGAPVPGASTDSIEQQGGNVSPYPLQRLMLEGGLPRNPKILRHLNTLMI